MLAPLLLSLLASEMPGPVRQTGLSEEDWGRLSVGEVVVKATSASDSRGEKTAKGAVVIQAPWRHAFDQIGLHEEMLESSSCMKAMEVVLQAARGGTSAMKVKETHQSLWMKASYTLDYVHDPDKRQIRWQLDPTAKNEVLRMSGGWSFLPLSEDKTLAIYWLSGRSGGAMPQAVEDYFKKMMVPGFLETTRRRVEAAHAAGKHGN